MSRLVLANRYRLTERIATGGMGSVYRATDQLLDRPVAVKVLKPEFARDATFLERFRREARAAARLSHPNVAAVYDYGERDSEPFIVMELVEGETLAARLERMGWLPWPEACRIAERVARALDAAHAHGLVHRDVKPANVLLAADGGVKVTDFGIALAAQAPHLTRTGMVLGSANYVAPEQAQSAEVGPAADLYSLGCVLFEMLTGSTPFSGATAVAIATQHVSTPVPDPRTRRPELPAAVADVVMRAMSKHPDERFPSARAMAGTLAALQATAPREAAEQGAAPWEAAAAAGPTEVLADPSPNGAEVTPGAATPGAAGAAAPGGAAPEGPAGGAVAQNGRDGRASDRGGTAGWVAWGAGSPAEPTVPGQGAESASPAGSAGRVGSATLGWRRRRSARIALAILAVLIVVALAVAAWSRSHPAPTGPGRSPGGTPTTRTETTALATGSLRIPDLRNQPSDQATAQLRRLGLVPRLQQAAAELPAGRVISTTPAAGSLTRRGATVTVTVSAGADAGTQPTRKGKHKGNRDREGKG